jgi:uncharacterized protein (DUF58 family)
MKGVPSRRFFLALAATACVAAIAPKLAIGLAVAVMALALVDALVARGSKASRLEARVEAPATLSQLEPASAAVVLENRGARAERLRVALDVEPALASIASHAVRTESVASGERRRVEFDLRAHERGRHYVRALHVRRIGPLGLWWRQQRVAVDRAIDVLPAFARERLRRRSSFRMRQAGSRVDRRRADRGEFESLREYVRGDDPRRLDWKATARRSALIVRTHQDERSQSLMLVVDAGRLMLDSVEGLRRVDWAVAAAAALSDAALGWRDHVGVMAFSDTIHALLPPGQHPPDRIPKLLASVVARPVEPDYPRALVTLARTLRRRSLVVIISDVIDTEVSAPLAAHVRQLAHRHLPVFVALRHPSLDAQSQAPVTDRLSLVRRAAATELLLARKKALESMRRGGIQVIDALPSQSLQAAVDHYVKIKQRGAL